MSLDQLAQRMINVSETGLSTMVLVTPPEFSLRLGFFTELVRSLDRVGDRETAGRLKSRGVEINFYQQPGGIASMLSDFRSRRQATLLQQSLNRDFDIPIQVRWTAILGRPRKDGAIVLGCCNSSQLLPPWAVAVELAKLPLAA